MNDVVAKVNGQPIRRFDLDNMVQGFAFEKHHKTLDQLAAEEVAALRSLAMEKMIARELIFQEALVRGVVADEAAIDAERQKIVTNFPSEDEFYATLEKAGITPIDYHRMLRQDLTVNLLTEQELSALPDPEEERVAEFYQAHSEKMQRKGRVRASHILLRVDADEPGKADEAIAVLRRRCETEDFAELARSCSACPSSTAGGDLGWFRRNDMVREFADVAFALEIGEISSPVRTQFGLHLIKLTEKEEDAALTIDEARPQIVAYLRQQAGAVQLQKWVDELRRRADVEVLSA